MKAARALLFCLVLVLAASAFGEDLALTSQRAKELMAEGKFADAIPLYTALIRARPRDPGLLMNLGMAEYMSGRYSSAARDLVRVLSLQPQHLPAKLFLGAAYLNLRKPSKAVPYLSAFIAHNGTDPKARSMLAEAQFLLGRYREAAAQYLKLSKEEPTSSTVWYQLGRTYQALSQVAFERLQKSAPESPYILLALGHVRLKQQQYTSAFFLFRHALEKLAEAPGAHAALAEVYRRTGHADWAKVEDSREDRARPNCKFHPIACQYLAGHYDQIALLQHARSPEGYYWSSKAYEQLALRAFEQLGKLPESGEMHLLKAGILQDQRSYVEAAAELRKALTLGPDDGEILTQLSVCLRSSRNYTEARFVLESLVQRNPNSSELNYLLGDTLLNLEQPQAAIPLLVKALSIQPELTPAHASLGRAYLRIDNPQLALKHLNAAFPEDEEGSLHYEAVRAYRKLGLREQADRTLQEYKQIQDRIKKEKAIQGQLQITQP